MEEADYKQLYLEVLEASLQEAADNMEAAYSYLDITAAGLEEAREEAAKLIDRAEFRLACAEAGAYEALCEHYTLQEELNAATETE